MKNIHFNFWTVLMAITFVELFKAVSEYGEYGRGLGYAVTVMLPLLVLLPLVSLHQLEQVLCLGRGGRQKSWPFFGHLLLLCIFLVGLVGLLGVILSRLL